MTIGKPERFGHHKLKGAEMTGAQRAETFRRGIVAGTAGGLAEVAWVMAYAGLSGGDAGAVARGVTTATASARFYLRAPRHSALPCT